MEILSLPCLSAFRDEGVGVATLHHKARNESAIDVPRYPPACLVYKDSLLFSVADNHKPIWYDMD